jgi:hypothetical protein
MTKRQARENFARVKKEAGIVEIEIDQQEEAAGGVRAPAHTALEAVAEAVELESQGSREGSASGEDEKDRAKAEKESEKERRHRMVRVRGGTAEEREAKGRVEKEVLSATAPESPISELLRCALIVFASALPIDTDLTRTSAQIRS